MKTPSIKKTIKIVKEKINITWYNIIIKPFLNYLDKKKKEREHVNLVNEFEKKFSTDIDRVKYIMYKDDDNNHINIDPVGHEKYLNEKLLEGRGHMLKIHKYVNKTSFLYDPEIIDIHNDNLNPNAPTISEISKRDYKQISDSFAKTKPLT